MSVALPASLCRRQMKPGVDLLQVQPDHLLEPTGTGHRDVLRNGPTVSGGAGAAKKGELAVMVGLVAYPAGFAPAAASVIQLSSLQLPFNYH